MPAGAPAPILRFAIDETAERGTPMTRFIRQSACRGHRPASVALDRLVSRPRLVSRLMAERRALRIIEAPDEFGKATVAFEYALMAFDFMHVFWINGTSPCFLRDIDAAVIAEEVLKADAAARLAVIVDLPKLSEERAQHLASEIDCLLDAGCEVLVTATPARDALCDLFPAALVVEPREMLVDAVEDEADALADKRVRQPLTLERQIPGVRWGGGTTALLEGLAGDGLVGDAQLLLWTLLALGHGGEDDARALLGDKRGSAAWKYLAVAYPCAGIDEDASVFEALAVPMAALRKVVAPRLEAMAQTSPLADREELASFIAGRLAVRGESRRAVRAIESLAGRAEQGRWIVEHGWEVLWGRAAPEVCDLYDSVDRVHVARRPVLNAQLAWAWAQLGNRAHAVSFAQRALAASDVSGAVRAAAALVGWDQGNAATREVMEGELALWLAQCGDGEPAQTEEGRLGLLAAVALAPRMGRDPLAVWAAQAEGPSVWSAGARETLEMRLLAAALVVEQLEAQGLFERRREREALGRPELVRLVASCHRALEALVEWGLDLGYGALRAAAALDRAAEALALAGIPTLNESVACAMRAAFVEEGRARASRRAGARASGQREPVAARDRLSAPFSPARASLVEESLDVRGQTVPLLRLRLFGSMEVAVGERDLTRTFLEHNRARLLLALLALHRGRELTRERLAEMLWPATNPRTGAKNFYRVWSDLWEVLAENGRCPYLLRDRYGCRLDASLFSSDVEEFERLNRQLLFGPANDSVAWERTLLTIQESFDAPLLPAEPRNEVLAAFRRRFASELVDGLLAASRRLLAQGEPQGALWFAREALRRNATREDAYAALMRAQMATDQRSAAVETFFCCRDFLADHLGLDPSPSLVALYDALLEGRVLPVDA